MIIELEKYNKIRELLIETRTTGSQGHICYWNRGQRVSVNKVAGCMGVEEMGCEWGTGAHTIRLRVRIEHRDA